MNAIDLLSRLRAAGVDLWAEGDRLRFSAPPGALTPELRQALTDNRPQVMDLLRRTAPDTAPAIARVERGGPLPVSFPQRRMWFFEQVHPGTATYHLTASWRITGDLDLARLRDCFTAVANRHEALRTRFELREDDPVQLIDDVVDVPLPVIDLTDLEEARRQTEADRLLAEECERPFDLAALPLMRTTVLRVAEDTHLLMLTIHHIVTDMWSMDVLMRELTARYAGAEPPPLPVQYADFAAWQRSFLEGDLLQGQLNYWNERLAGAPSFLELPTDLPRPQTRTFAGGRQSLALPAELLEQVDALCGRKGATRFMGLLAAFALLLSRYSGDTDLLIGSPIANRTRAEVEDLIGYFVNTLVLRVDLSGDPTFAELLGRVRETALGAYENQDVPVERLVEVLQPRREAARPPLFQTMFTLQNTDMSPLVLPGLTIEPLPGRRNATEFDLTLELAGEEASVHYNADLFRAETMARLLGHWRTLLEAIVADPGRQVSELPLLTGQERGLLLGDWNDTARPYPLPCVHERIARQARLTPDAPAVLFRDRALTYAELDSAADSLAARLRPLVTRGGPPVAVCVERSPEMIVSLLGVLKAGAAYLPIDTTLPPERLAYMLQDAQVEVAVTTPAQRHRFPSIIQVPVTASGPSVSEPASPVSASDLAYVIYTSGSTGKPKGVMLEHGNLANFLSAMDEVLGRRDPGVWLALTGVSFDIAVLELLWPLTQGWRVVVQDDGDVLPGGGGKGRRATRTLDFGLFYFAVSQGHGEAYRLLVEGAKFADEHDFTAVWTPERHFDPFGGFYPNPSVTSAALATITKRLQLRAGSVVLPLHNPIRVAEEWSVVDNLSGGRVGLSFASGWHADDFILAPDPGVYGERKQAMLDGIDTVRKLWRGEPTTALNGVGREVSKITYPRPVQPELPYWLTAAGSPDTFRQAGEMGAKLLTHLLGQSVDELVDKIALYRRAWRAAGHEGEGHVTLMVHTYVGTTSEGTRELVHEPFRDYLRSSFGLVRALAPSLGIDGEPTEEDIDALLDHAFEHYYDGGALMGTLEECVAMAERLREAGVDELACLIDFGIEPSDVLAGLPLLNQVRTRLHAHPTDHSAGADHSVAAQIARHGVTHVQCTPSLAGILMSDPDTREALLSCETLLVGGEALPAPLAAELSRTSLLNMYGPTETTIWSTTCRVTGEVSIGRPIANTTVYILDQNLEPLPIGVPGELYLGGLGVARGYLDRPGLTADRFRPSPYTTGARLYRTGDRARYLPDGRIEFLGRMDRQVKLGGHRIELGEIEHVLLEHPAVRRAAVIEHGHLVAYLVADGPSPAPDELRKALLRTLPEVMVPSVLIWLDALPLNSSGKVDYRALPDPDTAEGQRSIRAAVTQSKYVPPSDEIEETIAAIWQDVLKVDQVGMRDTFFELGGHSLMAIQMVSRLRTALGREVTLRTVFESATVADLAARVRVIPAGPAMPPLVPVTRSVPPPLSHAQQRMWFFHELNPGITAYHLSAALRLRGSLDPAALRHAFNMIVARHESLRTNVSIIDGAPVQLIVPTRHIPLRVIDLAGLADSSSVAMTLALEEARKPFDLEHDALLRTTLVRVGEHEHILLLTTHHIVSDSWSIAVMARELGTFYASISSSGPTPLPESASGLAPLSVQYADYAVWQREWLTGPVMDRLLSYWRQALVGAPPVLELPYDHPRGETADYQGTQLAFHLPAELSDGLKALALKLDVTVFVILLATFKALLHRWSGEDHIVVGVPVAGRDMPELEPLIGLFGNATVMHTDLSGDPRFTDLLDRVKETVMGAYDHQSMPVDKLVSDLGVERDLAHNPLFQVMFVYINDLQMAPSIGDLEVTPLDVHQGHVFMDLNLAMEDGPDGLRGTVDYSTALFNESTIHWLLEAYQSLLTAILDAPDSLLTTIALPVRPTLPIPDAPLAQPETVPVVIASTFTATPVENPLTFWDLPLTVEFAPYNQVFQQILDPASAMSRNDYGVNVILLRRQDWCGPGTQAEDVIDEFARALAAFRATNPTPFIVTLCPATNGVDDTSWCSTLTLALATLDDVICLDIAPLLDLYRVTTPHDPVREEAGNIPYTPEFYAALGAALARTLSAMTTAYPNTIIAAGLADLDPPARALLTEALTALATQGRHIYLCEPWPTDHPSITHAPSLTSAPSHSHSHSHEPDERSLLEKLDLSDCLLLTADPSLTGTHPDLLTLTCPTREPELATFLDHTWVLDTL